MRPASPRFSVLRRRAGRGISSSNETRSLFRAPATSSAAHLAIRQVFLFVLIGVAGFVAYVLFWLASSDQDGWLISVGIPVGLSLIAGLVCAWISV